MTASVIFSTYNEPAWLEKVFWGYECQTDKDFEIIVADDGSAPETTAVIRRFQDAGSLNIVHVWQEDDGFQKSKILNKAIEKATHDYLIFSDGDCIPRNDFVEVHKALSRPGHFLSGGYFKLPMYLSQQISREDIVLQHPFNRAWLKANGLPMTFKSLKLTRNESLQQLLNKITPAKATWNGHNSSGWKKDLVAVNGFNERMQYGGQDRELGERLMNMGIVGVQIRYSTICIHLEHTRSYKTKASIDKNIDIRKETRRSKRTWTEHGIIKN